MAKRTASNASSESDGHDVMRVPEPRGRVWLADALLWGTGVALLLLLGRLAYIEAALRPDLQRLAARQQAGYLPLAARRGLVLDRRGRVLAATEQGQTVFIDPTQVKDLDGTAALLGPVLGMRAADLSGFVRKRLAKSPKTRYVAVKQYVDPVEADEVRRIRLPGVGVRGEPWRRYPMGRLASHVLGFVGTDGQGLEGIEALFNRQLRGEDGSIRGTKDGRGRWIWTQPDSYKSPRDGNHVVLTIDANIQAIAETELRKTIDEYDALDGAVIIMNPKTGEVLALACEPSFDPGRWRESPKANFRNRALTDPIEPGSTFKPLIAAAAVEAGVVRWDEIIDCHRGTYRMGRRRISDMFLYGLIPFERVIVKSSNIGMAIIGGRMGNDLLYQTVRKYGFGQRTGLGLPGEDVGIVNPLKTWTDYSTGSIPFGQEISVTPIQLIRAFCSLVNGGLLLKPQIVHSVVDQSGQQIESFDVPIVVRRVLPEAVAESTRAVLEKVVGPEGTGRRAMLDDWQLVGKTGTPQVARNGRYVKNEWVPSFLCAGPARDPQVAMLVTVRCKQRGRPSSAYGGGRVAAPAASKIMAQVLAYLGVPPDRDVIGSGKPAGQVVSSD